MKHRDHIIIKTRWWAAAFALSTILWLFPVLAATNAAPTREPQDKAANCETTACWRRVHHKRAIRWCKRHPDCAWRLRWKRLPAGWRYWAVDTEACESGHNPYAHGGGGTYHGSMQFDLGTWAEAGGSGDPHTHSIYEQRWRAVKLAQRVGTGRWPVCGR